MTYWLRRWAAPLALALGATLMAGACGGGGGLASDGGDGRTTTTGGGDGDFALQVASYDLIAGQPQRFIAGAFFDEGPLLGFGEVLFTFGYLGTREVPLDEPRPGPEVIGEYLPLPQQDIDPDRPGPIKVEPSEARGVYGAYDVVFDDSGFWGVVMTAEVDGQELSARAAFEVRETATVPAPGDPAPRTDFGEAGATGVDPIAIDSRAGDGHVPDPVLHETSVADAIAAGQPVMVVVSTPVYCQSRFCGPITDAVEELATEYGDRMAFVHIEVWANFQKRELNDAAREWMSKGDAPDLTEPWVFVVDRSGMIVARFDNVATEAELQNAVGAVLG